MTDIPTYETIRLACTEAVATITLCRPKRYNAVSLQMHADLLAALSIVDRDPQLRALVLTGEDPAFCSGIDLKEAAASGFGARIDDLVRTHFNTLALRLRDLSVPVIAAVNGVAAGAGASLAMCCDLRVCSERASFSQAFVRIGLVPDMGSTWLLPRLVGMEKAMELAFTGDSVDAAAALELGLASQVVAHDELLDAAQARAARLAALPTRAIAMTRRAIHRNMSATFESALEHEAQLQQQAAQTSDHLEGVMAFLEKRDPVFTGR